MKDKSKSTPQRLTRTIPALRVTEETYQALVARKEKERRHYITEVARLALEDHLVGSCSRA